VPANFLHGVETVYVEKGAVPVRVVKSAVIALVGSAPSGPVNVPTLVLSDKDAAQFGDAGGSYTIPNALKAILDHGAANVVVINVATAGLEANAVTAAAVIGGTVAVTGQRTGLEALKDCFSLFGFVPKILIAPVFCTQSSVSTALITNATQMRAIALIDAPIGTTVQQAVTGRGPSGTINFQTSSDRAVLCYPHLKRYDAATDSTVLEPMSQRLAGLMAKNDLDNGYWWSPSNKEFAGVVGVERTISAAVNDATTEANLLNENGIVTVFNSFGTGFRSWGNRTAAWPTVSHPRNFINIRRTADIVAESLELAMLQFIDKPINQAVIDSIRDTVNAFLRTLVARGAIIDGECTFDPAKNPLTEIAAGHLTFDYSLMPPTPAERITFEQFVDIELLAALS
jgi:phage tail sheath protein FI